MFVLLFFRRALSNYLHISITVVTLLGYVINYAGLEDVGCR